MIIAREFFVFFGFLFLLFFSQLRLKFRHKLLRLWARYRNPPPPPWRFLKTYIFGNLIIRASQIRLSASNPLVGVAVVVI